MDRPAQSFLDGLAEIRRETAEAGGELSPAYFPLLDKLDPALIDFCQKALRRSQQFAEDFLVRYMLRDDPDKAKLIAADLNNVKKYLSHAAVIDADRALELALMSVSWLMTILSGRPTGACTCRCVSRCRRTSSDCWKGARLRS